MRHYMPIPEEWVLKQTHNGSLAFVLVILMCVLFLVLFVIKMLVLWKRVQDPLDGELDPPGGKERGGRRRESSSRMNVHTSRRKKTDSLASRAERSRAKWNKLDSSSKKPLVNTLACGGTKDERNLHKVRPRSTSKAESSEKVEKVDKPEKPDKEPKEAVKVESDTKVVVARKEGEQKDQLEPTQTSPDDHKAPPMETPPPGEQLPVGLRQLKNAASPHVMFAGAEECTHDVATTGKYETVAAKWPGADPAQSPHVKINAPEDKQHDVPTAFKYQLAAAKWPEPGSTNSSVNDSLHSNCTQISSVSLSSTSLDSVTSLKTAQELSPNVKTAKEK